MTLKIYPSCFSWFAGFRRFCRFFERAARRSAISSNALSVAFLSILQKGRTRGEEPAGALSIGGSFGAGSFGLSRNRRGAGLARAARA
jgi:hypothetical protein